MASLCEALERQCAAGHVDGPAAIADLQEEFRLIQAFFAPAGEVDSFITGA
jgi:hypothetical protein